MRVITGDIWSLDYSSSRLSATFAKSSLDFLGIRMMA